MRTNFIFYLEWVDQLEVMDENGGNIAELFVALKQYMEVGEVAVDLDPLAKLAFNQIRSQIDRDTERYEEVSEKRRKAAKKRWEIGSLEEQTDASECKPMQNDAKLSNEMQTYPYPNKEDDDEDDNNISNLPYIPSFQPPAQVKTTRFIPPTVEEVAEYCQQRGNQVDPIAFVNFYEAKGWMVGKNKMKKWKNAVITWERNGYGNRTALRTPRATVEDIMTTDYYAFPEVKDD